MVKHNNVLPNVHFHKWWQRYVRLHYDEAGRKQRRRRLRQQKAARNGVRPVGFLRPAVRPPTIRYNMKLRLGRGFTLEELKGAGISRKFARTIGIAVDHRRKNHCVESLNLNINRIKKYLSKLIIFPRKGNKAKKGIGGLPNDTLREKIKNIKQLKIKSSVPIERPLKRIRSRPITDAERKFQAYATLRNAQGKARNVGKKSKGT